MLSPTQTRISAGPRSGTGGPVGDALPAAFLPVFAVVGAADEEVVRERDGPEVRGDVGAERLHRVRDHRDAPAELLHAGEERRGARHRRALAPLHPGLPRGVRVDEALPLELDLVGGVVEDRLVGVDGDGPAPRGPPGARLRGGLEGGAVRLDGDRAVLGRVAQPVQLVGRDVGPRRRGRRAGGRLRRGRGGSAGDERQWKEEDDSERRLGRLLMRIVECTLGTAGRPTSRCGLNPALPLHRAVRPSSSSSSSARPSPWPRASSGTGRPAPAPRPR